MNATIEISADAAKDMLPCLESKRDSLEGELESISSQLDRVKTTIAELRLKLNSKELPLANGESLRQRRPKGQGDEAIVTLLKSLPPEQGLTMAQISMRSGVKAPTVYRILKIAKRNKGRFILGKHGWQLSTAGKVISPASSQVVNLALNIETVEQSVREKNGRIWDVAQRFGVAWDAINELIKQPQSRVYVARRGWLKIKE